MATDFLVRGNRRLTRYGRWALVALLPVLSGGCVWYQDLDMSHGQREHRIGKYSVRKQDPHLNRFYQLQQRIDQLESQLERGKIRSSEPHAGIHPPAQQVNQPVNTAIEAIKHKTNQAIEAIDAMILQFSDASNSDVRDEIEALAEQTPAVHQGAISGMLQRSASGEVIGSSSDGNRYNYSVVYVYPETTPWLDMWALLEKIGVSDKWRGNHSEKQIYFIYVGAYYTAVPAEARRENLFQLTGSRPELRLRKGYSAVAMQ